MWKRLESWKLKNVELLTCRNLKCWKVICISFSEWLDFFNISTCPIFSTFNSSRLQHFQHFSFQLFNFSTFPTSRRWSIQIYLAFWSLGWLIGGQLIGIGTNIVYTRFPWKSKPERLSKGPRGSQEMCVIRFTWCSHRLLGHAWSRQRFMHSNQIDGT